jgi:hypothetical protein
MWVLTELKWLRMRGPLAVLVNMVMHSWVPEKAEKVGNILKNFVSINFSRNLLLGGRSV